MKKSKNTKKDKQNQTTVFPSNEVMMMLEQMNDGIVVITEQSIDTSKKLDEFIKLEKRMLKLEKLVLNKAV